MPPQLINPPLVEALLEIKWNLTKVGPDAFQDPGYKLAGEGYMIESKKKFGYIQNLPVNAIPDELTAYTVRHQFRAEQNSWPLVQFGPGVATINFTSPYSWKKFRDTVKYFIPHLASSYLDLLPDDPNSTLQINSVTLRYINAIEWNWLENDSLQYLTESFHTCFKLPEKITNPQMIAGTPVNLNLQVGYPIHEPKGQGIVRLATGSVGQSNGLIWELIFVSAGEDAPQISDPEKFLDWLSKAHEIVENWFFALIEGNFKIRSMVNKRAS